MILEPKTQNKYYNMLTSVNLLVGQAYIDFTVQKWNDEGNRKINQVKVVWKF